MNKVLQSTRLLDTCTAESGPACPLTWNPTRPLLNASETADGRVSGFTVTVKLCVALRLGVPLSATFKVNELVVFACVTCGRHENAPLLVFNVALPDPLNRLKVRVCGGASVSVALAVKATVWPTFTV